jgi:hypothetical protein
MKAKHLIAIAISTAALVAACGDDGGQLIGGGGREDQGGGSTLPGGNGGGNGGPAEPGVPSGQPSGTNSPAGKAYFTNTLHPALKASCGTCHDAGPGPTWIKNLDIEASYKLQFQLGYVSKTSRILLKGPHSTSQGLVGADVTKFNEWVDLELQGGGVQAPPNVLEKISKCIDRAKFDAMQLQNLRTTQRTANNNTNQVTPWNENANNCTGCNNAPCRTCHAGDDATGFVTATGNPNLPATFSFEQTKLTNPAYLQKYFGVSPTGTPIGSNAIMLKATATQKDKAYTHPMFTISTNQQALIDAFVKDAVDKYTAGTCPP